jgi:hypothetical protein
VVDWERNWRGAGVVFEVTSGLAVGGTTWTSDGFWAPDGGYALIAQIVLFAWIAVLSGFLYMRSPSTVSTRDRPAVAAP